MFKNITSEKYRELLSYIVIFIATFGIIYSVIGVSFIPSSSMYPTLEVGHRYPYLKLSYLIKEPERFDIIIYDKDGTAYCKRVIGLPGDFIEFREDGLYINTEKTDTPYAYGTTYPFIQTAYNVPEGEFFVMGDNRENSNDSRYWEYPFIKKDQILGKVWHK